MDDSSNSFPQFIFGWSIKHWVEVLELAMSNKQTSSNTKFWPLIQSLNECVKITH